MGGGVHRSQGGASRGVVVLVLLLELVLDYCAALPPLHKKEGKQTPNEIVSQHCFWWNGPMNEQSKYPWGCTQWVIVLAVLLLGWMLIASFLPMVSKQGVQMHGVNNCKQIILSLKLYARDNSSAYPDSVHEKESVSANQVFRWLFKDGIVEAEGIFGCSNSMFVPDGVIGNAPDFAKALTPGECHWMLLKSQTDTSTGDAPVVVENAINGSWPPRWDVSAQSGSKRGRVWKGNKIIVGRNDGSVAVEKLRTDGTMDWHSPSNLDEYGKSWIDTLTPEQIAKLGYWDIEEK